MNTEWYFNKSFLVQIRIKIIITVFDMKNYIFLQEKQTKCATFICIPKKKNKEFLKGLKRLNMQSKIFHPNQTI